MAFYAYDAFSLNKPRPRKLIGKFQRFYVFDELLKQLIIRDVKLKYFIASNSIEELKKLNVPIINETCQSKCQLFMHKDDQFIIALEEEEVELRDRWLQYFSK